MYIKAKQPYIYEGLNFKDKAFEGWKELNYPTTKGFYPRFLHWLLFKYDIFQNIWHGETRLVFVQPVSLYFDVSTSVLTHKIIPFIWDCWPCYYDKVEQWLKKHKVKTAIFTSFQEMEDIKQRIPELHVIHCPEGVKTSDYMEGKELKNRDIDILEFGRSNNFISLNPISLNTVRTAEMTPRPSEQELKELMANAKITICFPRSITHPKEAEGIETLTQRYWEAMLSRMVIIGHCPKELEELIGYNPVIECDYSNNIQNKINDILNNIETYQLLVNKNREYALKYGDWKERMKKIYNKLQSSSN